MYIYFTYKDYKLSQNFRYTVFHAPHGTIIRRTIYECKIYELLYFFNIEHSSILNTLILIYLYICIYI